MHSTANSIGPNPDEAAVRFLLNARLSRFTVQVTAAGLLSAFGHNPVIGIREFEGEIYYNPDDVLKSTIALRIDPMKLEVASDASDKDRREIVDLMRRDVLQVKQYPEIRFECSRLSASNTGEGQYWVGLNGNLTLHGVTNSQNVSARVSVNGSSLRAAGEFTLRQTDYDIRLVSIAGVLKVKDELKFSFDVLAQRG